jgi:ADP-heptose:LPS heptosyltransferase
MKRIVIVRACAVGDLVQCTPLLKQIRADEPEAHITFATSTNVLHLLRDAPFVDELLGLSPSWCKLRRPQWRLWWEVARHGPFDAMISLEAGWIRNLGSLLVQSPLKAGLHFIEGRKPRSLFTHPLLITGDSSKTKVHASQQYLDMWLNMRGTADRGFGYDVHHLVRTPSAPSAHVIIAPGTGNTFARNGAKQWHADRFADLGHRLAEAGWKVSFVGGRDDLTPASVPPLCDNLLGQTSLAEVAELISQSAILVGNDSGLFHLAQGLGCPAIGIFGPTAPAFTGVFRSPTSVALHAQLPCMPCYRSECHVAHPMPQPCCMTEISVEQVSREVNRLARVVPITVTPL